jgi:hypothetical protein
MGNRNINHNQINNTLTAIDIGAILVYSKMNVKLSFAIFENFFGCTGRILREGFGACHLQGMQSYSFSQVSEPLFGQNSLKGLCGQIPGEDSD